MADSSGLFLNRKWFPMRWPTGWKDPAALSLLKGTCINYLVVEKSASLDVAARAKATGIEVGEASSPPDKVTILAGEWPGVKMSPSGVKDVVSAGPTGAPWVDSNGWKVRLAAALQPGWAVWVDAAPKEPHLTRESYLLGIADAAAYGGRWIISLDDQLTAAIAAQNPDALETWKRVARAASFMAAHMAWSDYTPEALVGVLSDFSGQNEFLSNETLNLLARTNEQYQIIPKSKVSESSFRGLKAVLYPDADPPTPDLRRQVISFVEHGGMLIAGPNWGELRGRPARYDDHPRYASHSLGKGRLVIAKSGLDDPYVFANDAVILVSHRNDLVRFWNGGALESFLTMARDRKRALLQMLFFARELNGRVSMGGPDAASVRVVGRYRSAKLWAFDQAGPVSVQVEQERDAVELHLPLVSEYAAVELEV